ncbi:hypothetical protein HYU93_04015 [Candidatus Daviesbacteria bacterium]|nr:hypothetical protein [Candidatus Daviesbacteria bacterium]
MNRVIVQVPMSKELKEKAETVSSDMGFSSLQEIIRLFLNKIAAGEVNVRFEETVKLSPKAVKRYDKMIDEIESGKVKTEEFTDTDSLMKYLNDN